MPALQQERQLSADAELADYTFEEGLSPVSSGTWDFQDGSDKAICPLFFPNLDDPEGPTVLGQFTVEFEADTADAVAVRATINGNDTGLAVSLDERTPLAFPGI